VPAGNDPDSLLAFAGTGYWAIDISNDLSPVIQALDESGSMAADVETTGLDLRKHRILVLSLATDRGTYWLLRDQCIMLRMPLAPVLGGEGPGVRGLSEPSIA